VFNLYEDSWRPGNALDANGPSIQIPERPTQEPGFGNTPEDLSGKNSRKNESHFTDDVCSLAIASLFIGNRIPSQPRSLITTLIHAVKTKTPAMKKSEPEVGIGGPFEAAYARLLPSLYNRRRCLLFLKVAVWLLVQLLNKYPNYGSKERFSMILESGSDVVFEAKVFALVSISPVDLHECPDAEVETDGV
jgi:hypothetical protein